MKTKSKNNTEDFHHCIELLSLIFVCFLFLEQSILLEIHISKKKTNEINDEWDTKRKTWGEKIFWFYFKEKFLKNKAKKRRQNWCFLFLFRILCVFWIRLTSRRLSHLNSWSFTRYVFTSRMNHANLFGTPSHNHFAKSNENTFIRFTKTERQRKSNDGKDNDLPLK